MVRVLIPPFTDPTITVVIDMEKLPSGQHEYGASIYFRYQDWLLKVLFFRTNAGNQCLALLSKMTAYWLKVAEHSLLYFENTWGYLQHEYALEVMQEVCKTFYHSLYLCTWRQVHKKAQHHQACRVFVDCVECLWSASASSGEVEIFREWQVSMARARAYAVWHHYVVPGTFCYDLRMV